MKSEDNFFDPDEKLISAEQEKAAQIQRMKELDDLRWVLSNIKGRRFFWKMLSTCGAFHASYVSKDANQTAFNEGRRDIGLRLLRDLGHANPKAYSQMEDEMIAENGKKRKVE